MRLPLHHVKRLLSTCLVQFSVHINPTAGHTSCFFNNRVWYLRIIDRHRVKNHTIQHRVLEPGLFFSYNLHFDGFNIVF